MPNNAFDEAGQLVKRWKDRLTLENLRLAERYKKGELRILMKFRRRTDAGANVEYCVLLDGLVGALDDLKRDAANFEIQDYGFDSVSNRKKKTVLVDIVKFLKSIKRIVPSVVRLQRVDKIEGSLTHALHFSEVHGFMSLGSAVDRKLDLFCRHISVGLHKLPHQMVQRTPKIVDSIAEDKKDFRRDGSNISDAEKASTGVILIVGNDFIGYSVTKDFDTDFEIADVLFSPFDFNEDKI